MGELLREDLARACEIAVDELARAGDSTHIPSSEAKGLFPKLRQAAERLRANAALVERLLDNAACASQERQLLRDADDTETALREAVRRNVAVPLIAANAALAARCGELERAFCTLRQEYFVAGGEMTNTEACRLIDAAVPDALRRALASQAEGER